MSGFTIGVDLGQAQDYTAISVIERVAGPLPEGYREDSAGVVYPAKAGSNSGEDPRGPAAYHLRLLERLPLGTKYPAVVERVQRLLATPPFDGTTPLVVDRTGVGVAVVDMFTAAGMQPIALTITGGDAVHKEGRYDVRVPKRELVGCLVMLLQSDRLKIAAGLPEGQTLMNELLNFKMKISLTTGNDSYAAWRESIHDDLVLAVAMACWQAEYNRPELILFLFPDREPDWRPWPGGDGE